MPRHYALIFGLFLLGGCCPEQLGNAERRGLRNLVSVADEEILALLALYDSASGETWDWKTNVAQYGPQWTFSGLNQQDPCADDSLVEFGGEVMAWQGVTCNTAPLLCYTGAVVNCSIIALKLESFGVSLIAILFVQIFS
jgi:hypothetical protein